jgi:hypothetical protein
MKIKAMRKIKKEKNEGKKKWIPRATLALLIKLMSPYEKEKVEGSKGIKHDIDQSLKDGSHATQGYDSSLRPNI